MGLAFGGSGAGMGPRGAIDQFGSGEAQGRAFNARVVARLLAFLRPYARRMALAFVAMLFASMFALLTPYLMKSLSTSTSQPVTSKV